MFPTHRPKGVTPIGVLNIIFGALGTIAAALVFLVGSVVATSSSTWESQAGHMASSGAPTGSGTALAAGGAFVMIIGVVALVCWLTLLVSGIGVLKLAPWGRTLSLVCGIVGLLLQGASLFVGGFNIMTIVALGYCGLLVYLFTRPDWKAAFAGSSGDSFTGTSTGTSHSSNDQRFRHAA